MENTTRGHTIVLAESSVLCCDAESQHAYITRARLTVCEVGVFLREILQLLKICPPPLFEEPLHEFITHGRIFERS